MIEVWNILLLDMYKSFPSGCGTENKITQFPVALPVTPLSTEWPPPPRPTFSSPDQTEVISWDSNSSNCKWEKVPCLSPVVLVCVCVCERETHSSAPLCVMYASTSLSAKQPVTSPSICLLSLQGITLFQEWYFPQFAMHALLYTSWTCMSIACVTSLMPLLAIFLRSCLPCWACEVKHVLSSSWNVKEHPPQKK